MKLFKYASVAAMAATIGLTGCGEASKSQGNSGAGQSNPGAPHVQAPVNSNPPPKDDLSDAGKFKAILTGIMGKIPNSLPSEYAPIFAPLDMDLTTLPNMARAALTAVHDTADNTFQIIQNSCSDSDQNVIRNQLNAAKNIPNVIGKMFSDVANAIDNSGIKNDLIASAASITSQIKAAGLRYELHETLLNVIADPANATQYFQAFSQKAHAQGVRAIGNVDLQKTAQLERAIMSSLQPLTKIDNMYFLKGVNLSQNCLQALNTNLKDVYAAIIARVSNI